jgi:hypothetical protein
MLACNRYLYIFGILYGFCAMLVANVMYLHCPRHLLQSKSVFGAIDVCCHHILGVIIVSLPSEIWRQCFMLNMPGILAVPEFIGPVFAKTGPKCSLSINKNDHFWACFRQNWVYKFGHGSVVCSTGYLVSLISAAPHFWRQ